VLVLAWLCLWMCFTGPAASAREGRVHDAVASDAGVSRARDIAATRAYIQAHYRLVRVARADLSASEGSISALTSRTVGECPLAGEGSYVNYAANQVSEEIIGTIVTTAYRPDADAIDAFVHAVEHLRWSDAGLTSIVRGYVAKLQNVTVLAPADICEDVKVFAAASFRVAPEATISFDKRFLAADAEAEEVPLRLLAPYEGAKQAALLRRTKQLEAPLAEAEADTVAQYTEIMRGLALSE
jgi:hypothetical protein